MNILATINSTRLGRIVTTTALAATLALSGMAASAPTAAAAGGLGTVGAIGVTCDNFANSLDHYVNVKPTPGYSNQRIWFQFAIWDDTRNTYVDGYWPGKWLYLDFQKYFPNGRIENSVSSQTFRVNLPDGKYRVWAQFAFENGATASYTGWIQANPQNYGGGFSSTCNL